MDDDIPFDLLTDEESIVNMRSKELHKIRKGTDEGRWVDVLKLLGEIHEYIQTHENHENLIEISPNINILDEDDMPPGLTTDPDAVPPYDIEFRYNSYVSDGFYALLEDFGGGICGIGAMADGSLETPAGSGINPGAAVTIHTRFQKLRQ